MSTIVRFYKDGKKVKEIISIGYLPVDERPVEGSRHLVTSGAVAEAVGGITVLVVESRTIAKADYTGTVTFETQVADFVGHVSIGMENSTDDTAHIKAFEDNAFNGESVDVMYEEGQNTFMIPIVVKDRATVKVTITSGPIYDDTNVVCRLRGLGKAFN